MLASRVWEGNMLHKPQFFFIFFLCLSITACSNTRGQIIAPPDSNVYVVDPVFRELYGFLGGKNVLGAAISPAKAVNGVVSQYFVAGLIIFDPYAPAKQRFQLGGLAKDFGIISPSESELGVAAPFQAFYDQLGGAAFVGLPLTGQVYNDDKKRSEQYFENLGFYQGPETDGTVRLLPYGVWRCGDECLNALPMNALPLMPTPTHTSSTPQAPRPTPQAPQVTPQTTQATPQAAHKWLVRVWESESMVSSTQVQEIVIRIQRDGQPLEGASASLMVSEPDGSIHNADFPPTDASGIARLKVAPIQTQNGALIPYQVCIDSESGDQYCIQQSYMIWTTP
jgi:hypothetical protein